MRFSAQDLHKGSQNLYAVLKSPAKANPRVKEARLEDGPGLDLHPSLSRSHSPTHRSQAATKGQQMGILQILTATEIVVFCSIFCIYLFR